MDRTEIIKIDYNKKTGNFKQSHVCTNKKITYICPNCNHKTFSLKIHTESTIEVETLEGEVDKEDIYRSAIPAYIDEKMEGKCPFCDKYDTQYAVDYDIADIIIKLNSLGLKTKYCCSGHFTTMNNSLPYILFENDYSEYFDMKNKLLKGWYIDNQYGFCLRIGMKKIPADWIFSKKYLDNMMEYLSNMKISISKK